MGVIMLVSQVNCITARFNTEGWSGYDAYYCLAYLIVHKHSHANIDNSAFPLGGIGGLMVRTRVLDLESQGSSPTSVRAFFSFPLFNLNALEFTQLYPIK